MKAILLLRNALLAAVPAVYVLEREVAPALQAAGVDTRLKRRPRARRGH